VLQVEKWLLPCVCTQGRIWTGFETGENWIEVSKIGGWCTFRKQHDYQAKKYFLLSEYKKTQLVFFANFPFAKSKRGVQKKTGRARKLQEWPQAVGSNQKAFKP
jgi:hypothetical protein